MVGEGETDGGGGKGEEGEVDGVDGEEGVRVKTVNSEGGVVAAGEGGEWIRRRRGEGRAVTWIEVFG